MDKHEKNMNFDNGMMVEEINITMPPEQIWEWNGMNDEKQDLEGARLQEMVERSCWKTNNEKNKLDMILWNTSQIMRWQPVTHGKRIG